MRVHHYLPGFIDHDEDLDGTLDHEVDTLEELFAFEWVSRWKNHPGFQQFMYYGVVGSKQLLVAVGRYDDKNRDYCHILAILDDGGLELSTLPVYVRTAVELPLANQVS